MHKKLCPYRKLNNYCRKMVAFLFQYTKIIHFYVPSLGLNQIRYDSLRNRCYSYPFDGFSRFRNILFVFLTCILALNGVYKIVTIQLPLLETVSLLFFVGGFCTFLYGFFSLLVSSNVVVDFVILLNMEKILHEKEKAVQLLGKLATHNMEHIVKILL